MTASTYSRWLALTALSYAVLRHLRLVPASLGHGVHLAATRSATSTLEMIA